MKAYKRFFDCGYIALTNSPVKNKVTVEATLTESGNFTACVSVWNCNKRDIIMGGQCFDELHGKVSHPSFKAVYAIWKKWHLNDLKAGCIVQEKALEKAGLEKASYDSQCDYLKKKGLYEVSTALFDNRREVLPSHIQGETYCYGTAWIKRIIPEKELTAIRKVLKSKEALMTEQEALA